MSGAGKKSLPMSWGWVRAHSLGEQRKRGRGTQWEEKEGMGLQLPGTLIHPPPLPDPIHTLHSGCWAWTPTPPQQEPKRLTCPASEHSLSFLV